MTDTGGTTGTPPTGPNSFIITCVFAKKHPHQRLVYILPMDLHPPQWEILHPPL